MPRARLPWSAMAARDPVLRFRFDFADLKTAPAVLRVVAPTVEPLPPGTVAVTPGQRPHWLPALLPVFRAGEPLRIGVLGAGAEVWTTRLRRALSVLFAAAGSGSNLAVCEWPEGLAVGPPGIKRVPVEPHAVVVAAELDAASIGAALQLGRTLEIRRALLALHGEAPALERQLGLDAGRSAAPIVRLPALRPADIGALHAGELRPDFGRACLSLAREIVARYLEVEN
jgi:hypothetical protein